MKKVIGNRLLVHFLRVYDFLFLFCFVLYFVCLFFAFVLALLTESFVKQVNHDFRTTGQTAMVGSPDW